MKRILVVSSANMDMVMNVDFVPVGGQTVIDKGTYTYVPGGKGANSAVAFSRLGAKCVFLTKLGMDTNGDTLLDLYKKEGMDVSYIKRDSTVASGLAAILVEKTGQNRIIVFPGANSKIELDTVSEAIASKPDALYMQFEINYDAIIHAANEASKIGVPIFIDAGPANKDFPLEALPEVTVFSPNESETEAFTGIAPTDEIKCKEAALKLLEKVKEMTDEMPETALGKRFVMMDNWNEWGEGHYIAPHLSGGFKYLQAIREVFTKRDNLPDYRLPQQLGLGPYDSKIDLEAEP
jgi:ribokinase